MTFQLIETGHSSLRMNITCKISSNTTISCGHHKYCLVCFCFSSLCVCAYSVYVYMYMCICAYSVCSVCMRRGMHVWMCLHVESRGLGRKSPTITLPPYSLRPCLSATSRLCRSSWSCGPTVSSEAGVAGRLPCPPSISKGSGGLSCVLTLEHRTVSREPFP